MSFEGRLDDANLLEVVRLLHSSAKEGKLTIQAQDKIGYVLLRAGEIISAKLGSIVGEDAIYQMTLWESGSFQFEDESADHPRSVKLGHTDLMIEAARRFSEWKTISKKIPSLEMIPEFVPQSHPDTPQVSLSTNEWVLLSKVDGHRNIRAIADGSKFGVFETCKIFYGLLSSGLLRVRAPAEAVAAMPTPAAPGKPRGGPAAPTFGMTGAASGRPSRETPDLRSVSPSLQTVSEKYLGSFASSILEKSLRKARVDWDDPDPDRQGYALKRAIDYVQRASSTILGPELAAQMAAELDSELEQRIRGAN